MKIQNKPALFVALFLYITTIGFAQDITLTGIVTNENGRPVPNALIKTWPDGLTSTTDAEGSYRIAQMQGDSNTFVYAIKGGFFTGCSRLPDPDPDAQLNLLVTTIPNHADRISPFLFGSNYWKPYHPDLKHFADQIASAAIDVVRLGGHSFDGTGQPWNEAAVDSLVDFSRSIDAEPVIQAQLYRSDAQAAHRIVRYANMERDYGIRYWSVGNEPDLYDLQDQGPYSVNDYIRDFRDFYHAMKAADPSIVVAGPELAWNYDVSDSNNWLTPFLAANGDIVDIVTIHRYPFFGIQTIDQTLQDPANIEPLMDDIRSEILRITGRNIPVALTETNLNPLWIGSGDAFGDSHYAGMWWAETLGRLIKKRVFMANFWTLVDDGPLSMFASDDGIYAPRRPRPTFYVHQLYKGFYGEYLSSESDQDNLISFASQDSSGNRAIVIINKSQDREYKARLVFNFADSGAGQDIIIKFPRLSLVRVNVDAAGAPSGILCYSIREFEAQGGVINADTLQLHESSSYDATLSFPHATTTAVQEGVIRNGLPATYFLSEAYPNPFTGATQMMYDTRVTGDPVGSGIVVGVYNLKGQLIQSLENRFHTPGRYQLIWNGMDTSGKEVPSGLYFFTVALDHKPILVRKVLKIK